MALPPRPALGASTKATNFDVIEAWMIDVGNKADNALPIKGVLGNVSLDSVIDPGVYYLQNGSYATAGNAYPASGGSWSIVVARTNGTAGTGLLQTATLVWTSAGGGRGSYQRWRGAPTDSWSDWYYQPSQRVDQTAGRAFYTWDHVNNRDQLLANSDTGVRDVSSLLINGWTGIVRIYRLGYQVTAVVAGVNGSAATDGVFFTPPAGFSILGPSTGSHVLHTAVDVPAFRRLSVPSGGSLTTYDYATVGSLHGIVTWRTADAWPTTLPGTAAGTIPNL